MITPQRLRINSPLVVSQVIEGEAILIHFESGCYYGANATGSTVLDLVAQGLGGESIAQRLSEQFPGAAAEIPDLVDTFLAEAQAEGLVVPVGAGQGDEGLAADQGRPVAEGAFVAPRLERFDDLQDLLMLDPIHDVDAVGWPVPPPGEATAAGRG
ncbi:MAG TPA: PqqD family protein [Gemmatimonadales bacterium]|nr:PqqD family protein [Gemmatimonadales bacterium]